MSRDRCDYRAMSTRELVEIARREGLDKELAIAAVERLARDYSYTDGGEGNFHWTETQA